MKSVLIRAAVAAAIGATASTVVNATAYSVHMSGASAQRNFWEGDLEAISTGKYNSTVDNGGTTVCFLTKTAAQLTGTGGEIPDLHALQCTISANRFAGAPALPTNINPGDTITMYYEAEYGSVWGIAPFIPGSNANTRSGGNRMELVPLAGGGTVPNANFAPGYSRDTDTCGGCAALQGPVPIDMGVADMDPILWASTDNWSYSTGDNASPPTINGTGTNGVINILSVPGQGQATLPQLEALETGGWVEINGQVFSVVVDNSTTPTKNVTNLSTQSVRAILTGQYKSWSQVPEVGAAGDPSGTSIVVCRRDHGSGSQVAQSQYFTQTECGGNNGINGSGSLSGAPTREVSQATSPLGASTLNLDQTKGTVDGINMNPAENLSTNDVKACLAANPGASIGIISLSPGAAYNTLNLDSVQANAHNAALGFYKFAFTTWGFNNSANSQPANTNAQGIVARLLLDAQKTSQNALPAEGGSMSAGQWNVGANTPQVVYAVQDGLNAAPTIATITANPSVPVAVWKNTPKSSCNIPINDNH